MALTHCCRDGAEFCLLPRIGGAGSPATPALSSYLASCCFVAGLAIVRVHNVWVGGGPVLLTVLGWVAILSGLARMLFPTQLAAIAAAVAQKPGGIIAGAIILLVLGAFLSFKGYSRD
jgi:hypothetical protein